MSILAVGQCPQCGAVVNVHWAACLVCHARLEARNLFETLHDNGACSKDSPEPPIRLGWLVTYRDRQEKLCGGAEDRAHGTVQECRWDTGRWTVCLTNGQQVPLLSIRAVGKTDTNGRICAAWTVREHGYDGNKQETAP